MRRQPTVSAEGMFFLFEAHPDLLPPAPEHLTDGDYRERLELKVSCIRCGDPSRTAMVIHHSTGGKRWLDLCAPDRAWVKETEARARARRENGK